MSLHHVRVSSAPDPPGDEPDYRFTYANERTFLAWLRTAVGLIGLGVAALQLLPELSVPGGRQLVGISLVLVGGCLALAAEHQHRANDKAMRQHLPLPTSRLVPALTASLVALAALVVFLVVIG